MNFTETCDRFREVAKEQDFELVHGESSAGNSGEDFSVIILVRRPQLVRDAIAELPTTSTGGRLSAQEQEQGLFYKGARSVLNALQLQRRRLDPDTMRLQTETQKLFMSCFHEAKLGPIFVEQVPNEGYGADSPDAYGRPWYMVTTSIGHLKVGWRRRVIVLDWSRSTLLRKKSLAVWEEHQRVPTGDELFPNEGTTKLETSINAWGYPRLADYLQRLREYSES